MKRISFILLCILPFLFSAKAPQKAEDLNQIQWYTDYDKAVKVAKKTKKTLLLNFTGSDWCGWCLRLDREVFSKPEFVKYAQENLVCVKIDFPKRKKLDPAEKLKNEKLLQKHEIKGFPSILLVNTKESILLRTGYQAGGAKSYIEHLQSSIK